MPTEHNLVIDITILQPVIELNGSVSEIPVQEATLYFGQWMKGDPGDTPELEYATNEDIDALFE